MNKRTQRLVDSVKAVHAEWQADTAHKTGPNARLDSEGRIIWIDGESKISRGHSVCHHCQKDMPNVWDVICSFCHHTFCYEDSIAIIKLWYCKPCFEEAIKQALSDLAEFAMHSHNGAVGPQSCRGCYVLEAHKDLIESITDLNVENRA